MTDPLTAAPGGDPPATPEAAQSEIAAIQSAAASDPKHPYNDRRHPENAALHCRVQALYAVENPGVLAVDDSGPSRPTIAAAAAPATAEAAQSEIASIRAAAAADPKHPYNDRRHPEHKALHQRMNDLYGVGGEGAVMDPNSALQFDEFQAAAMAPITDPAAFEPFLQNLELDPADSAEQIADGRNLVGGWMAELGLPAGDASRLVAAYNKNMSDPAARDPATRPSRREAGMRALKAVWKGDFATKLAIAERVVGRFDAAGDGQFSNFLRNTGLDIDPHMVRALFEAAERNGW